MSHQRRPPARRAARPAPQPLARRFPVLAGLVVLTLAGSAFAAAPIVRDKGLLSSEAPATAGVAPPASTPAATPAAPEAGTTLTPSTPRARVTSSRSAPRKPAAPKTPLHGPYRVVQGRMFKVHVPTTFQVATFNVLGSSHTAPDGDRPTFRSGTSRMYGQVDLLRSAGIDVVGFQEFQAPQNSTFVSLTGWEVYPGFQLERSSQANSIAWDPAQWELLEAHTLAVPYFFGNLVDMPYVLLRNRETRLKVWFFNTHNPADKFGSAQRYRDRAVQLQAGLAQELVATGHPVIYTGDMNDRARYFCSMTAASPMQAANGGSTGSSCSPPAEMDVDWIMGSLDVEFSGFFKSRYPVERRLSDHPFIFATATVD